MSGHIVSLKIYFSIFIALLVLTALTVVAASYDVGKLNTPLALTIASVKATLIVLYFMHVRYSSWLTRLIILSGLFFVGILFFFTFCDYLTRGW